MTGHRGQMSQFCGHAEECKMFNNPESLRRAKQNVEKYYPVVGVTEYMNMTLEVLEDRLPAFFPHATQNYEINYKLFNNINEIKLPVTDDVLAKIKPNFSNEYEFYEFCKQRLFEQWGSITNR